MEPIKQAITGTSKFKFKKTNFLFCIQLKIELVESAKCGTIEILKINMAKNKN